MDQIEIIESIWVGRFTIVCSPEMAWMLRKALEKAFKEIKDAV